jgi:thioredoxin-related protein
MVEKTILIFVSLAFCFRSYSQGSEVIRFERSLSWAQVKEKAKMDHKYIFLDCFTTWCGPCKKMEQEVYTSTAVARYVNENFLAVKIQLDTTDNDKEDVRQWYQDSHQLMHDNRIEVFPTYIFLNSEGKIVHRGQGYKRSQDFLILLQKALDPNEQYYTLLDEFRKGELAFSQMPTLAAGLERIGEGKSGLEVADSYIVDSLLPMNQDQLYTKSNIRFIREHIVEVKSPIFLWLYRNAGKMDSVMRDRGSRKLVEDIIVKDELLNPGLKSWEAKGERKVSEREWLALWRKVKLKYDAYYARRCLLDAQIYWYRKMKNWDKLVYYRVKEIDEYGLDTAGINVVYSNNIIYSTIFMHSNNRGVLRKAISWMKIICEAHPDIDDYWDTYANLLYKTGNIQNAIALEEKAYSIASEGREEIKATLTKMKNGKPTWDIN